MIGSNRRIETTGHALYVCPHQDDEQLAFGAAIRADLEAGRTVDVLLVTDGRWAGARLYQTMIDRLGYTATPEEFAVQRDKEFIESCRRMGALPIVPPITERIEDGHGTPQAARTLIEKYGKPGSLLRGTTNYDYHLDHRSIGFALIELEEEGFGTDLMLMQSAWSAKNGFGPPSGRQVIDRSPFSLVYQWPYRHVDVSKGWWGIGYLDVAEHFDYISGIDPDTYWHPPITAPAPTTYTVTGVGGADKVFSTTFIVPNIPYVAGSLVLLWITSDNSNASAPVVSSVSRPPGESGSWQQVRANNSPVGSNNSGVVTRLWKFAPTITQTANATVTQSAGRTAKGGQAVVITPSDDTVLDVATVVGTPGNPISVTGEVGDLVVAAVGSESNTVPSVTVTRGGSGLTALHTQGGGTTGSTNTTNASGRIAVFGDDDTGLTSGGSCTLTWSATDGGAAIAIVRPVV